VLRQEKRVSMAKERLLIRSVGEDRTGRTRFRVEVDYEFLNESAVDVETEVAFPIPEYSYRYERTAGPIDLEGFRASVDGNEVPVVKDARAILGGRDYTSLLRGIGVDPEHHGYFSPEPKRGQPDQLRALTDAEAKRLASAGLIRGIPPDERWPNWAVAITWHWTQVFPAGRAVRVRHEYTPAAGFRYSSDAGELLNGLPSTCGGKELAERLDARQALMSRSALQRGGDSTVVRAAWVEYVLKTASSWKMPIREFELVIERPKGTWVSLCWGGDMKRVSDTRFSARIRDYVPKEDLLVYFFAVK